MGARMRILVTATFVALLLTGSTTGRAEAERAGAIPAAQAAQHVGSAMTVCGRVASTKLLETSKSQPTFLNLARNRQGARERQPVRVELRWSRRAKAASGTEPGRPMPVARRVPPMQWKGASSASQRSPDLIGAGAFAASQVNHHVASVALSMLAPSLTPMLSAIWLSAILHPSNATLAPFSGRSTVFSM